ncbi:uncharacterized protein LOC124416106 [Diprion similis]|uniref:uncharacterized protein LOC124416106 n=1 Tax=Diprion similis TaxID=362088 RepID=UPI001EF7A227|nr:uncharacterized protein LOC124416106 [Diprion similis]XP_046752940.1 uncharacterized protein LOC124416106 [Diprion similis]XP_046752941.1 uncharacterized protein LOC124416106 [Diprion similis]XP_046752943.1 uncharacterized protein LOC124416106 [Diprion similis]
MIPDVDIVYATSEEKIKNMPTGRPGSPSSSTEDEGPPITAWQRYQQFLAVMEASGEKMDRKVMLEAMFRGNDLAYGNH